MCTGVERGESEGWSHLERFTGGEDAISPVAMRAADAR
jgi:hypothetical protein